ncbi:hypothetical protein O7626_26920 [Micromonospora sp. WMMD1102]|uniref:hypothetical protein n=1 Tax=Micromonospora sp. WMMD1102 TaxID=3016105 RepID=UPI00241582CB|nr:hypothetical protein [Micromonospora sp. WMMD1102]MDG4789512.1 hypothetical protein [Micromonospora sp. WMMD1102]
MPPAPTPEPPQVGVGVRLLDAPANRRDDIRAYQYIVDHLNPGTTIRRRMVVANTSQIRRKVTVYPAAADVDGDRWTVAPERTANELSSWVTVDSDHLRLKPEEEKPVWVTIAVPENASAGERYGVVWAETPGFGDESVRHVGRAGIRIYLSVGPGGEPPSDFTIGRLAGTRAPDGTALLTAEVTNTGERALDLAGSLMLKDGPDELTKGPIKVEAPTLALGATATITAPVGQQVPDGPWTATLDLRSGWTRRSATGQVSFAPGTAAPAAATDHTGSIFLGGLATSVLVLALFAGYAVRQRRHAGQPGSLRVLLPAPPFRRTSAK